MTDPAELFWVAIKGSLVPSWSLPVPYSVMQQAVVQVGRPGEETLWLLGSAQGEPPPPLGIESNYDVLIGFHTAAEQQAAVTTFLEASIDIARAEFLRATRDEVVIWGRLRRP